MSFSSTCLKMIKNNMYQVLSELESDELCERVADGGLTEEGYEITCKILNERGVKIPIPKTYEPRNESFFISIKRFYKERPFLSIMIFSGVTTAFIKLLYRLF